MNNGRQPQCIALFIVQPFSLKPANDESSFASLVYTEGYSTESETDNALAWNCWAGAPNKASYCHQAKRLIPTDTDRIVVD